MGLLSGLLTPLSYPAEEAAVPLPPAPAGRACSPLATRFFQKSVQHFLNGVRATHLPVPSEVDLQRFAVVLKPKRCHREKDVLAIDGLALFLLAFFRCCAKKKCQ